MQQVARRILATGSAVGSSEEHRAQMSAGARPGLEVRVAHLAWTRGTSHTTATRWSNCGARFTLADRVGPVAAEGADAPAAAEPAARRGGGGGLCNVPSHFRVAAPATDVSHVIRMHGPIRRCALCFWSGHSPSSLGQRCDRHAGRARPAAAAPRARRRRRPRAGPPAAERRRCVVSV